MKIITAKMLDELTIQAGKSRRLRMNYNIHEDLSDPVQRLFIAAEINSYFRPHHHLQKSEFAIVLRGLLDVLILEQEGTLRERISLGPETGNIALEIPANTCHTWIPLAAQSVFFEVKQGPYDPEASLVFASWAPEEGSVDVETFQERLRTARIGESVV
ncbi:MAG: WbuC family cupin fold metalloprotein [Syntrophaceae bacterium]|mgnify:FL=1|jgi:cupin fold WbuC family metalloprotein|nr:WbuC family cupin fold metalloprotein [Syntrophaceae bacterium]HOC60811.1 WbuC family cupin fold metalloprotein [Smithellaceae bacterium]